MPCTSHWNAVNVCSNSQRKCNVGRIQEKRKSYSVHLFSFNNVLWKGLASDPRRFPDLGRVELRNHVIFTSFSLSTHPPWKVWCCAGDWYLLPNRRHDEQGTQKRMGYDDSRIFTLYILVERQSQMLASTRNGQCNATTCRFRHFDVGGCNVELRKCGRFVFCRAVSVWKRIGSTQTVCTRVFFVVTIN
jgi:hypothetical protein